MLLAIVIDVVFLDFVSGSSLWNQVMKVLNQLILLTTDIEVKLPTLNVAS